MMEKNLPESFGTLSETINGLAQLGYVHDFNIKQECLICQSLPISLSPDDFTIDHIYRFEGDADPDYQSILYAISSHKYNVKGVLVDGYGISSDTATNKLIEKLTTHNNNEVNIEIKSNHPTPKRPGAEHILDAPFVEMNLEELIKQIKSEATWAERDRNSLAIFKSDTMRIVLIGLHKNAELKPHKAEGVISVQVLEGEIDFKTEQQVAHLTKGQMITLHENITHSVTARKESIFLLTLAMKSR